MDNRKTRSRGPLGAFGVLAALCAAGMLAMAAPAGAVVLYDQINNVGAGNTLSEDSPGAGNASELADDFTVPAGQTWAIEQVDVLGGGVGVTLSMDVFVYADAATLPGALLASRTAVAPTGTDPNWSVPLSPSIQLQPGTYWIGVQANTSAFQSWGWVDRTIQAGSGGAWRVEYVLGGCAGDFTFRRKTTCIPGIDPDQVFRLNGTSVPDPSPAPPPPLCAGRTATSFGTEAAETLSGTSGADVIAGLGGKDRITGLGGDDVICGGAGKDTLLGGGGKDRLFGEAGKDLLKGGKGKDVLKGGAGKDVQTQ